MKTDNQILEEMDLPVDIFRVYRRRDPQVKKSKDGVYYTKNSCWKVVKKTKKVITISRVEEK